MIEYQIHKDYKNKLSKWKEQQTPSSDGIYSCRIIEIKLNEYSGNLLILLEPIVHVKDEVELTAKKDCKNCDGKGYIRYWYAQDESRVAPCEICFPNDLKAVQAAKDYERHRR